MMKTKIHTIRFLLFAAIYILFVAGCAYDDGFGTEDTGDTPELMSGEISLTLNLSFHNNGSTTRAGDDDSESLRPGVDEKEAEENKIHSIYVFFQRLQNDGTPYNEAKRWFRFTSWKMSGSRIRLPIEAGTLPVGTQNIFIGVNLTEEQANHFAKGDNLEYIVPKAYQELKYGLSEVYAPGGGIGLNTNYPGNYTRKDIAMFCTEGQSLVFDKKTLEYTCHFPFVLKRNVAKVLTTCKVSTDKIEGTEPEIGYCILKGDLLYPEVSPLQGRPRGWIRQSDVQFMVNALNLKSFIMQKSEWVTEEQRWKYEDPNYDKLDNYFTINETGVPIPLPREDFFYNAVQTLNQQSAYYANTLVYEQQRLPQPGKENSDSYYEGLYCPENTFTIKDVSDANKLILEEYNYPWPMITHVSITAKLTPKELYVEKAMTDWLDADSEIALELKKTIKELINNGTPAPTPAFENDIVIIDAPSEKVAQTILTASLRKHYKVQESAIYDHEQEGFPENTYLSISNDQGEIDFYTYGAALIIAKAAGWGKGEDKDDPKQLASFKAMPRGRGYYYTYIDNRKESERLTPLTYADSQVERNMYYILTIRSFSGPGRTGSEPEYVKVHTQIVDWKKGGNAIVELD